ncbi:MAG: hypothetical protein AAGF12_01305 [Myxococcota bacterium]
MAAEQYQKYINAFMILVPTVVAGSLVIAPISLWMVLTLTYSPIITIGVSLFGYVGWAVLGLGIAILIKEKAWGVHPAVKSLAKVVIAIFVINMVVGLIVTIPSMMMGFEEGMQAGMRGGQVDQEALTLKLFEDFRELMIGTTLVGVLLKLVEGFFWWRTRSELRTVESA